MVISKPAPLYLFRIIVLENKATVQKEFPVFGISVCQCYVPSAGEVSGGGTVAGDASCRGYVICGDRVAEVQQNARILDHFYSR